MISRRDFGISHRMKLSKNQRCGMSDVNKSNHASRWRYRSSANKISGPGKVTIAKKC